MSEEELNLILNIHHTDGTTDIEYFDWDDSRTAGDIKDFIFQKFSQSHFYNVFTNIEIKVGDLTYSDDNTLSNNKIDAYISEGTIPNDKSLTLQNILDRMKKSLYLDDSSNIAISIDSNALSTELNDISNNILKDVLIIAKEDKEEEEEDNDEEENEEEGYENEEGNKKTVIYNCNIPLNKIVKHKKILTKEEKQKIEELKEQDKQKKEEEKKRKQEELKRQEEIKKQKEELKRQEEIKKQKELQEIEEKKKRDMKKSQKQLALEKEQQDKRNQLEERLKNKPNKADDFKLLTIRYCNETKQIYFRMQHHVTLQNFNDYITELLHIHQRYNLLAKLEPIEDSSMPKDHDTPFDICHYICHLCLFENKTLKKEELEAYLYIAVTSNYMLLELLQERKFPIYYLQALCAAFSAEGGINFVLGHEEIESGLDKLFALCIERFLKPNVTLSDNQKSQLYKELMPQIKDDDSLMPLVLYLIKNNYIKPIDMLIEEYVKILKETQAKLN